MADTRFALTDTFSLCTSIAISFGMRFIFTEHVTFVVYSRIFLLKIFEDACIGMKAQYLSAPCKYLHYHYYYYY